MFGSVVIIRREATQQSHVIKRLLRAAGNDSCYNTAAALNRSKSATPISSRSISPETTSEASSNSKKLLIYFLFQINYKVITDLLQKIIS